MTDFTRLSIEMQHALTGLLFLAVLSVFFLLIYKYITTGKIKKCIAQIILFVFLFIFIAYLSGASLNGHLHYTVNIPYALVIVSSFFFTAYSVAGMLIEHKRNKQRLSPASIKEALDNLNSGVCFADDSGRIVLINYTMAALFLPVLGSYPQTIDEINSSLERCSSLGNGLYRFFDERVWLLNTVNLQERLPGFTQTAARDVTALYAANEQLEKENQQLKQTNEEIKKMMGLLADRIREQETLQLKMRVHDDIGTSLITITNIMRGNTQEPLEQQLSALQNAISYFSTQAPERAYRFCDAVKSAEDIGVTLLLDGVLPDNAQIEKLITFAARECVTNCIRHAKGNRVIVTIRKEENAYSVKFTNNGKKPAGEITEGGGLGSLRKKIESCGGKLHIDYFPEFALLLSIPEGSNNYDKNDCSGR